MKYLTSGIPLPAINHVLREKREYSLSPIVLFSIQPLSVEPGKIAPEELSASLYFRELPFKCPACSVRA
jgi:hypothetical protein